MGDHCHWSWAPSTVDFQPSMVGSLPVHWFTEWGLCLHWSRTVIWCGISTEAHTESTVWRSTRAEWNCAIWTALPWSAWTFGPSNFRKKFGARLRHSHRISIYGTDDDTTETTQAAVSTGTAKKYKITVDGITDCITVKMVSENWKLHWEMHHFCSVNWSDWLHGILTGFTHCLKAIYCRVGTAFLIHGCTVWHCIQGGVLRWHCSLRTLFMSTDRLPTLTVGSSHTEQK